MWRHLLDIKNSNKTKDVPKAIVIAGSPWYLGVPESNVGWGHLNDHQKISINDDYLILIIFCTPTCTPIHKSIGRNPIGSIAGSTMHDTEGGRFGFGCNTPFDRHKNVFQRRLIAIMATPINESSALG